MPQVATVLGETLQVTLSPSFVQRAACPLCLKWTYIEKLVTRYSRMTALRGQAAHLAIANLTSRCLTEEIAPRRLKDEHLRDAITAATPHEIYAEIGNIFNWVDRWRERIDLQPKNFMGHEEPIAIDEHYNEARWEDAAYRGIVDLFHKFGKTAIVWDYKTQPNVLSQAALDQHEQGSFYCWLVSRFYPKIEEFVFRIWYLRHGFYGETRRTKRDLELFEQKLLCQRQKVVEIQSWDPIPGEHCGVCDFIHLCPLGQDCSTLPTEIITAEQAQRVASELRAKEEWAKQAKAKLKVYVEHNDAVALPGYAYGFRASESVEWDRELVEDVLRDYGLDKDGYFNPNGKKLAQLFKRARREEGALLDRLEAARALKAKTSFRGYKVAGDDEDADEETEGA